MTQDINRKYLTPRQAPVKKIDPAKLSDFVKQIHESVCQANKGGSIKVWVTTDNNGNLAVSANAATGFEIIIPCNK